MRRPRVRGKPDIVADITRLSEHFKLSSIDEILSVHVIEHFYFWEVHELLKSWKNLLKPGGLLILETPNLLSACVEILRDHRAALPGQLGQRGMWPLYGDLAGRIHSCVISGSTLHKHLQAFCMKLASSTLNKCLHSLSCANLGT